MNNNLKSFIRVVLVGIGSSLVATVTQVSNGTLSTGNHTADMLLGIVGVAAGALWGQHAAINKTAAEEGLIK